MVYIYPILYLGHLFLITPLVIHGVLRDEMTSAYLVITIRSDYQSMVLYRIEEHQKHI